MTRNEYSCKMFGMKPMSLVVYLFNDYTEDEEINLGIPFRGNVITGFAFTTRHNLRPP